MVTIQKDRHRITVTLGAYRSLYKTMGYHIVNGPGADHNVPPAPVDDGTTPGEENDAVDDCADGADSYSNSYMTGKTPDELCDEEEEEEEPNEKPISEMDFRELKEYASSLGLNVNGLSSKRAVREAIRAHLS